MCSKTAIELWSKTPKHNLQQYFGVDGAELMRSVTVFAEQAEANTRHRVDQATRQAASAVMTEAELRHTAAAA